MIAVIDCGTTNTRIFILNRDSEVAAEGIKKIGVRDTSITGSTKALKEGVEELYYDIIRENNIRGGDIEFAIASGMITSEIGLIEIPHLVAPVGLEELAGRIERVFDKDVLDIGIPVYFIRGIRNNYPTDAGIAELRQIDFMRGEEVQCMGVLRQLQPQVPVNIVVFSSHTKIIHIDAQGRICRCISTISGQQYEALKTATNVGKSIEKNPDEPEDQYTFEEIVNTAQECVNKAGIVRTMLMPRFMEVLLKTTSRERCLFVDAAIAEDDMRAFEEFHAQGYGADRYILLGHKERCELYTYLIHKRFGETIQISSISDYDRIFDLTIKGALCVAESVLTKKKENH